MLQDPGSFTIPVFFIGWPGRQTSEILAMAAIETSPSVSLHSHSTEGWNAVGARALYRVNIVESGTYRIYVKFQTTLSLMVTVSIGCIEGQYRVAGWVGKRGIIGDMGLSSSASNCLMDISITSVQDAGTKRDSPDSKSSLSSIVFTRVSS